VRTLATAIAAMMNNPCHQDRDGLGTIYDDIKEAAKKRQL